MAAGQFVVSGAEFLGLAALFARFGRLAGWRLGEVALLYGMINVSFALAEAFARGFDTFAQTIRAGGLDRLLVRPRSVALQVAGEEVQLLRVGRLLQGLAVLAYAARDPALAWTAPKVGLVLLAVGGGACIFVGLFVLQATLSIYTVETLEVLNTVTYGGTEAGQYPLGIYRPWFRAFFTFVVPIACASYLPASVVLGRPGVPTWAGALAPLVGVAFLVCCLLVFRRGLRRYVSTGS
jgi:ABC-2 type transport system permease protein